MEKSGKFIKEVVVVRILQNHDKGQVYALRNFLRKFTAPKNISVNIDAFQIYFENHSVKEVNNFVDRYKRGLSHAGHGGYRFDTEIIVRKVDLEAELRNCRIQRDALEQELESERQHEADLGDKWGDDRRKYEKDNDALRRKVRRLDTSLERQELEYDQMVMAEREERRQLLQRWRRTPVWRVAWQRLLALISPGRNS